MSYKSIATVVHDPSAPMAHLEYAIEATRFWGGHLHIFCAGIDRSNPGFYYANTSAVAFQSFISQAQDEVEQMEAAIRERLANEDIGWDLESATVLSTGVETFLAEQLRFSDLAILPLPYEGEDTVNNVACLDACMFSARLPVLLIPRSCEWQAPENRILVAWDDGSPALAAAKEATPLICRAKAAEIYMIDPKLDSFDRSDPGGRLAQKLSRLGAKVEISVTTKLESDLARQLNQRAVETQAEMIVMGAYGHSRLREAIIGGVTRSMLEDAKAPIFMAH